MADPTDWNRISPLSVVFFIFNLVRQVGLQALPGLAVLFAAGRSTGSAEYWAGPAAVAVVVLLLGFGLLSWMRFRYRVAADRVLVRKGVLHREELDIDFDRIQNIIIREPFYMRPLDLAVLAIDTAGSKGKEIQLAGIDRTLALGIRSSLLGEDGQTASAVVEADAPAEPHDGKVLLELERRDVLIYGLTANVMLWLALAIGAIFGSGDFAEEFIGQAFESLALPAVIEALRREGGTFLVVLAVGGMALVLFLLLPAISMLGALFRYDGYRLTVQDETFRKSSGLLNRHDDTLRRHKIQAVVWKQNFIARWFGRVNLQLHQASAGTAVDTGDLAIGGRGHFLVPSLEPDRAAALSGEFLPGCDTAAAEFSPIDQWRFVRVKLAVVLGIAAIPSTILTLLVHPLFVVPWAVIGGVALLLIRREARQFGWAVSGAHGFFRHGLFGTTTTVFPLFKIQRVDISQTPIQRRRGLAHLTVHLASHSLTMPFMRFEDAAHLRNLALYSAESSQRRWY